MRDIEFRCWYDNHMHKVCSIDFSHKYINLFAADIIRFEDGILMQYTGLKDKNSKKIFDGDIVKCKLIDQVKQKGKWVNKETYENYEVVYSESDLGFRFKDEWMTIWKFENCELEIIGNVYDNPELLEVK